MYDTKRLKQAFIRVCAGNLTVLSELAGVDRKTARTFMKTGKAHPETVYKVASALGFKVTPRDFSAIMTDRPTGKTA